MAALGSPLRTFRNLVRELRYAKGQAGHLYRDTEAYRYLREAFRAHQVRKGRAAAGCLDPPLKGSPVQLQASNTFCYFL